MDDRNNSQQRKLEPRLDPLPPAAEGAGDAPIAGNDYPAAGEMPAWLKEPEPRSSLTGRRVLAWGGALIAIGAVVAGGLWLRDEQKSRIELEAIAKSSRAADAALAAAAAPDPALIERRPSRLPPLVTLPPDGAAAAAPAPPVSRPVVVPPVQGTDARAYVAPPEAVKPDKPVRPLVARAPARLAPKPPVRALTAAKYPPAPSHKMPLAQNVIPKSKLKAAAASRKAVAPPRPRPAVAARAPAKRPIVKAVARKPAPKRALAAAAPKARAAALPPRIKGTMLPPPRVRAATLPAPREYPRDPVPVPRNCAKGELARDCAN